MNYSDRLKDITSKRAAASEAIARSAVVMHTAAAREFLKGESGAIERALAENRRAEYQFAFTAADAVALSRLHGPKDALAQAQAALDALEKPLKDSESAARKATGLVKEQADASFAVVRQRYDSAAAKVKNAQRVAGSDLARAAAAFDLKKPSTWPSEVKNEFQRSLAWARGEVARLSCLGLPEDLK